VKTAPLAPARFYIDLDFLYNFLYSCPATSLGFISNRISGVWWTIKSLLAFWGCFSR